MTNPPSTPSGKKQKTGRTRFLLINLLKGLIWMSVIVGGYFYVSSHFDISLETVLGSYYERPDIIFSIFLGSEIIFGIFPPELFMIWSLRSGDATIYIQNVAALASISYAAGIIGYFIGRRFGETKIYQTIRKSYLRKAEKHFVRFGGFLIIVAALTPVPFAGVCMLTGAVKYPFSRLLLFTSVRFLRFASYAFIIWETNILQ
jgi:membrane protein YqaA with SNARE-associated domain